MVDLALLQSISYIAGALGVCVAAFYYVMTLRSQQSNMKRTLETRQIDILNRQAQMMSTSDFMNAWTDVVFNQNYLTYDEWRMKYGPNTNPKAYANHAYLLQYYEIVGGLLRRGLVGEELIKSMWQPLHIVCVWDRVEVVVKGWREIYKDDSIYRELEWLFTRYVDMYPEMNQTIIARHKQKLQTHDTSN